MDAILSIKFDGQDLASRSLPIYELGSTLISLQRIVNKAALFTDGELDSGIQLAPKKRESLALQICQHKKGSDLWGLAPYLSDPVLGPIWQNLIALSLAAVGHYTLRKIGKHREPEKTQLLIVIFFLT